MAILLETRARNVVPRWRDFQTTVQLGELGAEHPSREASPHVDLTPLVSAWEAHHGLSFAGDLISAALVNNLPDLARDASKFVLEFGERASASLRLMATHVLGGLEGPAMLMMTEPVITTPESSRQPSPAIARAKKELGSRPNNAILWMDLAYLYAVRGLAAQAERAIRIALQLAPSNRFVLRSAARFLVHQDRLDEAHALIRRAPGVRTDPWLLSAEIAISMAAESTPFFSKAGVTMLAAANFSDRQLSELSSAIGTLEASHGNTRKAKRHLRNSLIDPTDNSLAQATWLSENGNGIELQISEDDYDLERGFEARAYRGFAASQWKESLGSSLQWIKDQPFSSRAVRSASFLANSIFQDHDLAETIIKFGQISNPHDPAFHVGLAYAYARRDRLDDSVAELKKISSANNEVWLPAALDANYGLISYRRGQFLEGRQLYALATKKADKLDDKRTKVAALTNWAMEEMKYSREMALSIIQEAQETAKRATGPDVPFTIERVLKALETSKDEPHNGDKIFNVDEVRPH